MSQHVPDFDVFKQMPKVVVAFSTFQKPISGDADESALSIPIGSLLKMEMSPSCHIRREWSHPGLKRTSGSGRFRQIDFVGEYRSSEDCTFALESKIHNEGQLDRLIRDLIKLFILVDQPGCQNAQLLFLLLSSKHKIVKSSTGEHMMLEQSVYRGKLPGEEKEPFVDLFDELLPCNESEINEKNIWLGDLWPPIRKHVEAALEKFDKTSVRGDWKVRLVEKDWSDDYACCLWRFEWNTEKRFELARSNP